MKQHLKTAFARTLRSRVFILAAGVLSALLIVTGITFAWMVSTDIRISEFGFMQYLFGMELIEPGPVQAAVKGSTVTGNEVHVENTGDIPMFVRLMVFPTLVAPDGVTLLEVEIGEQVQLGALGPDWVDGGDGYYYYLGLLAPGAVTANPLFDAVTLDTNIAGNQLNATLNIALAVESIDGTGSFYRDAWWGGAVPSAAPLDQVDAALQMTLGGN